MLFAYAKAPSTLNRANVDMREIVGGGVGVRVCVCEYVCYKESSLVLVLYTLFVVQ